MPPKRPKMCFWEIWGSGLASQITKNRKNVASKRPQRRPRKKHTISHHFWVGPALENEAPVEAGARFSRNRPLQKMSQKGSVLTSLFDAFGHQRPQKDDLGTTRKFVEKLVSPF